MRVEAANGRLVQEGMGGPAVLIPGGKGVAEREAD